MLLLSLIVVASINASAYPMFLEMYKSDKLTNPKNKDVVCNFCHMSPSGGDERNPFGQEFEKAGEVFTPMLRAQFPERFAYPATKVNDNLTIHFSDPDSKVVILESGGTKVAVDVAKQTVDGRAAVVPGEIASATPAPAAAPKTVAAASLTTPQSSSSIPVDPYAREGAFFGQTVVDLPNGKPQRKGGVDFWIGHRFVEPIFQSNTAPDLFGLDSTAIIAVGAKVGLTNRLSVGAIRSSYFRTLEVNSAFQVSRQGSNTPLTLQVRGSIEGRNNFIRDTDNPIVPWIGYGPSLQVIAVRTFADRVSLEAVPTFAFNTRSTSPFVQFGAEHSNTIAMGLAGGIRILKTVSIVGEAAPTVWGFRGSRTDRPTASFAIEKSTFRHTFSLVFSDTRGMTVNRYAQGTGGTTTGLDFFGIGFNIFRRIR